MRELGRIYGEGAIVILVVDVQIDSIRRDVIGAEAVGNLNDTRLWVVAVAGLLETERPEWRKGCGSSEPGVGFDDVFGVGPVHQVVVDGTVRGSKGILIPDLTTEVKEGAPRVVEEDAERAALAIVDEIRDALIDRVGGLLPAEVIGIPHREDLTGTIKRTGFVAEAEEVGVDVFLFVDVEAVTMPFDRAGVLLKNFSAEVGDSEAKRCIARYAERSGVESHAVSGYLGNGRDGGTAGGGENCPGGVLG